MQHKPTLTTRLIATGCAFLLLAVLSIGLTLWVTWKLEGGAASINEAGRLRLYAVRMALALRDDDAARLHELSGKFDASMQLLRTGNPARPLSVPWSADVHTGFDALAAHWQHARADWADPQGGHAAVAAAGVADEFVVYVERFVNAMEVQISRWTAALHVFQIFMLGMAVVATIVFMVMSYFLVLAPLSRMQHALARVRQGDLATRVPVDSDDEFGQLAQYFNQMADALQSSHEELERKVREKTASVEERNQRLSALYAVSALVADAGDLQVLAQGFARIVREVAGADAAMVRWSDAANARYVLLAGDGLPPGFAEREQCLETGACVCSQPKAQARLSAVTVAAEGGTRLPHCHEFGFRSVISVPVRQHQQLLAQVTLLYRQEHRLTRDARELLETMAQHLANGIEGLRVSALEREAAVAEERGLIARELHDSIAQSLAFLKIQTELLQGAIAKGDDAARDRSVAELREGVRESYADVRELLVHFRTRTQDEDIEQALRSTLSKFELQSGLSAHLSMQGQGMPLAPDVQIQVLHVVQEALSNVRKHAQARVVRVSVQRHPCWRFEVSDDGRGFEPRTASPDSLHVGLGIMADRASRVGALLRVDSRPGEGTCVTLELPRKAVHTADPDRPGAETAPAAEETVPWKA